MTNEKPTIKINVEAFYKNLRFYGELLEENDTVYKIFDLKEKLIVQIPKHNSVVKFKDKGDRNE